jgi:DNA polymerase-3 subunit delta
MDALALLERASKIKPAALFVLTGDEDFLRRQAQVRVVRDLLDDADPAFALTTFEGDTANWSVVKSELDTLPFLSPRRVVLIEKADKFVSENRSALEKYVAAENNPGTLILDVKTWPANTKLAKATPEAQTIVCSCGKNFRHASWCRQWAKKQYGKELDATAADVLVELVGTSLGQLDQEISKLAIGVERISREHVEALVGRSRQAETFKIFDAIGRGDTAQALGIMQRLFDQGNDPMQVLGAFSWQLRRLAAVSRLHRAGLPLPAALQKAGVPPFAAQATEQQLRHLGRDRMDRIYDILLETDLGMKGDSPLAHELIMERLVVRLARKEQKSPAAALVS